MWDHMRGNHWWGMGLMGLFWIVILAILMLVFVWLARSSSSSSPTAMHGPSAEEILKQRYARGEIEKEEYERRLQDLRR